MSKAVTNTIIKIVFCILLISSFNCSKEVTLPEVITLGVKENAERWNGISVVQFVYIGEGKVISDGGGDLIYRGFCFSSTNESPTLNDAYSSLTIDNNGSFISRLNLQNGQIKYFLRAVAKNKAGVSYGETVTYTSYCTNEYDYELEYKAPPMFLSPSNGTTGAPIQINLSWYDPGFPHDLYLDTSPDPVTKIASDVKSSSFRIDNLTPSTTYYWKVIKRWSTCKDVSSEIISFTTSP